jgi:hypothetical protein
MSRPAWWIAAETTRVAKGLSVPHTAAEAFAALGTSIPALAGLTYAELGHTGRIVNPATAGAAR